jgi:hypothetical protein
MHIEESFNDVLIECVKAYGGSKTVGSLLWPEKTIKDSQNLLLACLNTDRPEKLNPEQVLFIISLARKNNVHTGIEYICKALHYSIPTPIEPEDEKALLMREFIEAQRKLTDLANKIGEFK